MKGKGGREPAPSFKFLHHIINTNNTGFLDFISQRANWRNMYDDVFNWCHVSLLDGRGDTHESRRRRQEIQSGSRLFPRRALSQTVRRHRRGGAGDEMREGGFSSARQSSGHVPCLRCRVSRLTVRGVRRRKSSNGNSSSDRRRRRRRRYWYYSSASSSFGSIVVCRVSSGDGHCHLRTLRTFYDG